MTQPRETNKASWRQEDIARLKKLFDEGMQVMQEIEDLKAGLSETVKAIAEELDVKAAHLNKAIKVAHKATLQDERDNLTEIEDILEAAGRLS